MQATRAHLEIDVKTVAWRIFIMKILKRVFEPHNVHILEKKVITKERYLTGRLSVRILKSQLVKQFNAECLLLPFGRNIFWPSSWL